jgi:hypothetical protein
MAFNMSSFNSALPASYSPEAFNRLLAHCRAIEDDIARLSYYANDATREVASLNLKLQESRKEVADLEADLEAADVYGKAKREEQKILQSRIAELEHDRDLKDPIFRIGVSIRVRYLEMAKKMAMGSPRARLDTSSIEKGNEAAHHAMGEADAVLFQINTLSTEAKDRLTIPFTELYRASPEEYASLPKKMRLVINCEATIRTLNVLNEGSRPIAQRQHALDQIQILHSKYAKLSKEDFDTDEDVSSRLARLVALTKEIVEEDRQSTYGTQLGGRRQSSKYIISRY